MMLWIAEAPGGGAWILPAMSPVKNGYDRGTSVFNVTEDWVTVKGGAEFLAQFVNESGSGTAPKSAYVRYLAWR